MSDPSNPVFTALELLDEYLTLLQLAPKPKKWPALTAADNAPRYYRFQRLRALFQAFGLPPDFVGFPRGDFLRERDPADFPALGAAVAAHLDQMGSGADRRRELRLHEVVFVYANFFRLLQEVRALQGFNSGVMEAAPGAYSYAVAVTGAAVAGLETPAFQVVTRTLRHLIDPANRSFTQEQLVSQHDFPTVNLWDLDIDWM